MISALAWVSRASVKDVPIYSEPTPEELEELSKARIEGDDEDEEPVESEADEESTTDDEMDEAQQVSKAKSMAAALKTSKSRAEHGSSASKAGFSSTDAAMAELDMDHYDSDDAEPSGQVIGLFGDSKHPGMVYHSRPEDDPYITQQGDSDSDRGDFVLKGTDRLILAARNEDDVSHLEVWVYEEADDTGEPNLYVHHDVMLPAFPLSLAWMDCSPSDPLQTANLAVVGSLSPGIEVWDMDVLDAVEPIITLGGELPGSFSGAQQEEASGAGSMKAMKQKKAKKKSKKALLREGSHEDAVLGLSWNTEFRNVLASASADKTVKVWDLATAQCQHTLTHHKRKVQAVAWNPAEAPMLLSGGFDKVTAMADVRAPDGEPLRWKIDADVEALAWAPHAPTTFLVSTEDGLVCAYDARSGPGSAPLFRLSAHDAATSAMSFNPALPNLMATASTDMKVKLWDLTGDKPSLIAGQDLKVGAAFTAGFCQDAPWLLAAGGAMGTVAVWDIMTSAAVTARYGRRLAKLRSAAEA